jgi:hypothetical protein
VKYGKLIIINIIIIFLWHHNKIPESDYYLHAKHLLPFCTPTLRQNEVQLLCAIKPSTNSQAFVMFRGII